MATIVASILYFCYIPVLKITRISSGLLLGDVIWVAIYLSSGLPSGVVIVVIWVAVYLSSELPSGVVIWVVI
jgi:hypothetical protein